MFQKIRWILEPAIGAGAFQFLYSISTPQEPDPERLTNPAPNMSHIETTPSRMSQLQNEENVEVTFSRDGRVDW